jgi:hypothetical protein
MGKSPPSRVSNGPSVVNRSSDGVERRGYDSAQSLSAAKETPLLTRIGQRTVPGSVVDPFMHRGVASRLLLTRRHLSTASSEQSAAAPDHRTHWHWSSASLAHASLAIISHDPVRAWAGIRTKGALHLIELGRLVHKPVLVELTGDDCGLLNIVRSRIRRRASGRSARTVGRTLTKAWRPHRQQCEHCAAYVPSNGRHCRETLRRAPLKSLGAVSVTKFVAPAGRASAAGAASAGNQPSCPRWLLRQAPQTPSSEIRSWERNT